MAKEQFRGIYDEVYVNRSTQNLAAISDGDEAAFDVTVTGAQLGDIVEVSANIDLQNLQATGNVRAAGIVEVTVSNSTGGTVDLAAAEFVVVVKRPRSTNVN